MFRQNSILFIADENGVIHIPEQISNLSMIPLNFEDNQNIQEEPTNITPETLFEAFYDQDNKNAAQLKSLIEQAFAQGIDPNITDKYGGNLLSSTYYLNSEDITQFLLKKGLNPNIQDILGYTLLHHAGLSLRNQKEEINIAELLLKNGALTELTNASGYTPLQRAVDEGHKEIVKLLLQYGADLNPKAISSGIHKDKSLIELVPDDTPELKAFLQLAKACKDNDFSIIVTSVAIKEFFDWKISIKPKDINCNFKLFSKHLSELYNFKEFLRTKPEFDSQELKKLNDTLNLYTNAEYLKEDETPTLTLKTLLEFNITKNPELYKVHPKVTDLSTDIVEKLKEDYEIQLTGKVNKATESIIEE
ncbi:ankyrin repeat domain-containing protein [Rickettsia endosymbiont of Orchestes rusci]|uniref:ankyrin repeat domain-containing protein n=1 Tax=Rickettsia endosymbiont of Orchestes rusci TaxID=3066250 RepID=UPI00313D9891